MEYHRPHLCLFILLLSLLSYYSQAYVFYAGGRDGWVLNPSENYNLWAGRNRFRVNDTIVYKYKKGSNSVLVVNKDGYDKCNKTNPIKKFEDGDSVFKFDRSGPFYFISGTDSYCEKGQKLIVVVLAVRRPKPYYPPAPPSVSPSPVSQPPVAHPPSPSMNSPSPAPGIMPPAVSPAPSYPTPAYAPAPTKTSPSPSPVNTPASSPTTSPTPSTSTPEASPPAPPANTPSSTPGSSRTPSVSPSGSANPSSSNETAPPPNRSGAWGVAPSSLWVYSATIVVGAVLGELLIGQ